MVKRFVIGFFVLWFSFGPIINIVSFLDFKIDFIGTAKAQTLLEECNTYKTILNSRIESFDQKFPAIETRATEAVAAKDRQKLTEIQSEVAGGPLVSDYNVINNNLSKYLENCGRSFNTSTPELLDQELISRAGLAVSKYQGLRTYITNTLASEDLDANHSTSCLDRIAAAQNTLSAIRALIPSGAQNAETRADIARREAEINAEIAALEKECPGSEQGIQGVESGLESAQNELAAQTALNDADVCATDGAISYIKSIISFTGPICNLLLLVRDGLSSAIGSIISSFNYVFGNMQNVGDEVRSDGDIREFWQFVLSIANYILIAALIAMAFGTSLRLESYTIKKVLPNLLIGFVLANASLFIVGILFDLADLLSSQILRSVNPITAFNGSFNEAVEALKTGGLFGTLEGIARGIFATLATIIMSILWGLGLVVLWLFFWIRYYALQLYAIMAPLAFMSIALPSTRRFFDSWSSGLISWVISKPVAYTVLGFGLAIVSSGVAGIFGWVVGLGAMAYAIILPFQIKGIGSSLAAQLGGAIKGFGISAASSRVDSALIKASTNKGASRTARAARGIASAIQEIRSVPVGLKRQAATIKSKTDSDLEYRAALRSGDESVILREQERQAKDIVENNKNIPIGEWGDLKGNKARQIAALQRVLDNPMEIFALKDQQAKEIFADESLKKALGLTGMSLQQIKDELYNNSTKSLEAFALMTDQAKVDSAGVLDTSSIQLDASSKQRWMNIGNNALKEGFVKGVPIFTKSGDLIHDTDVQTTNISNRIGSDPALFAKAIIAALPDIKAGRIDPHIARLFAQGHFTDAVAKQLPPTAFKDLVAGMPALKAELAKSIDVKDFDTSGRIVVKNTIAPQISTTFNEADALNFSENDTERALKMVHIGGDKGSAAMAEAMNRTEAEATLQRAQKIQQILLAIPESKRRMNPVSGAVEVEVAPGVWQDVNTIV